MELQDTQRKLIGRIADEHGVTRYTDEYGLTSFSAEFFYEFLKMYRILQINKKGQLAYF
jgi:hypothetical protein